MKTITGILAFATFAMGAWAYSGPSAAEQAAGCALNTTCVGVKADGTPTPNAADYVAQCSGRFPDFIVPQGFLTDAGTTRLFKLSQNYPTTVPVGDAPWKAIDYRKGEAEASQFLLALRDYALEGMVDADFQPDANTVRAWFHMPLMNYGPRPREPRYGVTNERTLNGPEIGLKPGHKSRDYAVGFYNQAGAVTIGQVWRNAIPDLTKAHFADGTMTFKVLFSDAQDSDFADPSHSPLKGSPAWTIETAAGETDIRLMQMDVAVADPASPTGWVFGTLAYDADATNTPSWYRLRPVGLSWGNDPGVGPSSIAAGQKLLQTTISSQAPAYALAHLGWAGRTNGPIDNPVSGCLSCHGTAEYPAVADILPVASCQTEASKMIWFRNFDGATPFGRVDRAACTVAPDPTLTALDFSLQLQAAVQSVLQFGDVNPCSPSMELMNVTIPQDPTARQRIER